VRVWVGVLLRASWSLYDVSVLFDELFRTLGSWLTKGGRRCLR
jgi:hypothetical protein